MERKRTLPGKVCSRSVMVRSGRYYIRIDSGELVSRAIESEVSLEDAISLLAGWFLF